MKTEFQNKNNLNKSKKAKILIFAFISILLIITFIYSYNKIYEIENNIKIVNYNEDGSIFYQVYLKENDVYETDYLESGMEYLSSLIDEIRIKFNYELHAEEKINYEYIYNINYKLLITNQNKPDEILYVKEEVLVNKNENSNEKDIVFSEDINIKYDTYNDIVRNYKDQYGVTVDSKLLITMSITTRGSTNDVEKELKSQNELILEIPLSKQTTGIDLIKDKIDNSTYLTDYDNVVVTNEIMFNITIVSGLLLIINLLLLISNIHKTYFIKDIYTKKVNKYLKEYDRLIVKSTNKNFNENNFVNKVVVTNIEELIDAHDSTGKPIIYYEIIKNQKSYFIIMDGDTLYKYEINNS